MNCQRCRKLILEPGVSYGIHPDAVCRCTEPMTPQDDQAKTIVVRSWRAGKKFTCLSCGKGKFEALEAINKCPKCGQGHTIKVQL